MTAQNLLVELLVEELPPKALSKLGQAFASVLVEQLQAQGLCAASVAHTAFASPRRLAVHVGPVLAKAADRQVQQKLMPVSVGLDAEGQPTPALLKNSRPWGPMCLSPKPCWPLSSEPPTAKRRRFFMTAKCRAPI